MNLVLIVCFFNFTGICYSKPYTITSNASLLKSADNEKLLTEKNKKYPELFLNIFFLLPTFGNMLLNWIKFVADTIVYVKNSRIDIISELNNFHSKIQFTYEVG